MPITFISYRREDSTGFAGRLHEELEQRLGDGEVFRDVDTLRPGQDFVEGIRQRLQNCGTFVALIGRTWLNTTDDDGVRRLDRPDDYVVMEISEALARPDVLLVPVLVGGATMPAAAELPDSIRALARRQALVLRDDTWEDDVDRLADTLAAHAGGQRRLAAPRRVRRNVPMWAAGALALVVVVATIGVVSLRDRNSGAVVTPPALTDAPAPATPAAAVSDVPASSAPTGPADVRAYAIDVQGNPEVAFGDAIYTILAGSVVDRGTSKTLWLRLRSSNESRVGMLLSSDAFQLVVNGETLATATRFGEVQPAFSLTQKLVSYELSSSPSRADFRVAVGGTLAKIPLDLRPSARPAIHDQPDASDALSRASLSTLVSSPIPLPANGDVSATLLRVTRRRFANLQRLTATVRYENKARVDQGSWMVLLHIVNGDDVIAPTTQPGVVVRSLATYTGDTVFDLPSTATSVQLRVTADKTVVPIPLRLP